MKQAKPDGPYTAYTYMLRCADGSLYTGWTNDLEKRLRSHQSGRGAKYTKSRRPVRMVYSEQFETKEEAMRREWQIKQLTRAQKEALIQRKEPDMISILLVEDDRAIAENLTVFLQGEGFALTAVSGQQEAVELLIKCRFDLALVDISLADGNGFAVCAAAKARTDTPVIFLTASGDEYSVVTGLDMGADDYISKPFRPRELVSRIRTVLRRTGRSQAVFRLPGLTVDTERGQVMKNGQEVFLSALEYRLLLVFCGNPGKVLSRSRLLEEIWDVAGDYVNDNTLTVYIKRLRDKIEDDPQNPQRIRTVRGLGYKLGD